jgi:uncharacterized protein DUF4159
MRRGTKFVALVVLFVLAAGALSYAQRRRGGFGGNNFYSPRRPDANTFRGDFTFCRLAYRAAPDGDGNGWGVDYPRADQNLPIRLSELTKTPVSFEPDREVNHVVILATDPELFQCPFVMSSEFGGAYLDENEAKALREYMLKGGFYWADDAWGEYAWESWMRQVRKIFPSSAEYPVVDLPMTHSMFHTLFDPKRFPQIPAIGGGSRGRTDELWNDPTDDTPYPRAILDHQGRVMMFISMNTDFGDAYEREGDDPSYFYNFSVEGYAIGINVVLYAMTH